MATTEVRQLYNMEQGVSLNGYIDVDIDGEVKSVQVSVRNGMTVPQVVAMTDVFIQSYRELRTKYPRPGGTVLPAGYDELKHNNEGKKSYEHKPVANIPEGLPEGEYYSDEFDYFVVEPQPDNKATVKFYKDSLQFAVGAMINKWKHESVKKALEPLADVDPSKAEKYRVAGVQFWTKGNEYTISKGERKGQKSHYKDFRAAQQVF